MRTGWQVPVATSLAHFFAADGHSLCGRLVSPRMSPDSPVLHCLACEAAIAQACKKHNYSSKIDALLVLAEVKKKDSTRRLKIEQRAYYHPPCRAWHLTSRGES